MKRWAHAAENPTESIEYIEAMTTIGSHTSPNFTIAVNPDSGRAGDCYFKYFNREVYSKATAVARINIREASRVYHTNSDGKTEWKLNSKVKKALVSYFNAECDEWADATNWQSILYHWNIESHTIDKPFPKDKYRSKMEAFLDGYYDTDENLANPSYVASNLEIPDYTNLPN